MTLRSDSVARSRARESCVSKIRRRLRPYKTRFCRARANVFSRDSPKFIDHETLVHRAMFKASMTTPRGSFFTVLSISVSSLLGNRVTRSLRRRDDCARLAVPVRNLPGVSRRDTKGPWKNDQNAYVFFLPSTSKLL